ncbi:cytochrome c nitrite reductase small subunit [Candidatus Sumerlaeota bacterium]|nr:cytochrome c nitrite reductase small subunit [Candidatus Sumerlaeota bacterium]
MARPGLIARLYSRLGTLHRGLFGRIGILHFIIVLLVGAAVGMGMFTFGYGKGFAYLSNNPTACANCHVMQDHYDSWMNSSHRNVATCNDCHLSHHPVGKWITKTDNGFFHSLAFTTGDYHKPIQIKPRNRRVTQNACLYCHADFVHEMLPKKPGDDMMLCVHCHKDVGHSNRR